jgi:hypothetical protein
MSAAHTGDYETDSQNKAEHGNADKRALSDG